MNIPEYLINDLIRHGKALVPDNIINEAPEFKKRLPIPTPMNIALILDGHQPYTDIVFDVFAFQEWCVSNNIEYYHNGIERWYELTLSGWEELKDHIEATTKVVWNDTKSMFWFQCEANGKTWSTSLFETWEEKFVSTIKERFTLDILKQELSS